MPVTIESLGIDKLSRDERLALVQDIWDGLAAEAVPPRLSDARRRELERRAVEDDEIKVVGGADGHREGWYAATRSRAPGRAPTAMDSRARDAIAADVSSATVRPLWSAALAARADIVVRSMR